MTTDAKIRAAVEALVTFVSLALEDGADTPEQLLTLAESLPVDSGCVRGADE